MKKPILLSIFFIIFSVRAFCFPDMQKYPHRIAQVKNSATRTSKSENAIKFSRVRFEGFNGYYGICPLTGYEIHANIFEEKPECSITSPNGILEHSYFYMEADIGANQVARYFYFKDKNEKDVGRITIFEADKKVYGLWQEWVK